MCAREKRPSDKHRLSVSDVVETDTEPIVNILKTLLTITYLKTLV